MADPGTLYLVPTPIGHPGDITLRAIEVLRAVDLVAAEDTRNAQTMLRQLGIDKPIRSYFDHNERQRAPWLVEKIVAGESIAVISDAGMPMLNDPGYHILKEAHAAGVPVVVLPGASSVTTALVASGLPTTSFLFVGFLPRDPGPRDAVALSLRREPHTLVAFESPHRIRESLEGLARVLGPRPCALAFELTKPRERVLRGTLVSVRADLPDGDASMGEITLVIGGAEIPEIDWERPDRLLHALLAHGLEPRAIRDILVDQFELPRRTVYQRVLDAAKAAGRDSNDD